MMQVLYNNAVIVGMLTIFGAPIMKCFVWRIPLFVHAVIFFFTVYAVYFAYAVTIAVGVLFKVYPTPNTGYYALIGVVPAVGWLVTRILAKTYDTPTKFPAVGARVMFVLVPLVSAIVVGAVRLLGI